MDYSYEEYAALVDRCESVEELKALQDKSRFTALRDEFWEQRKILLTAEDALEKEKALAKSQWLQAYFGCSIPLSGKINRFTAPYGLYGIFISSGARVGKDCLIFPHVTIGSNLLPDSPHAGFPTLDDNVFVGAGAKIIGNVTIGSHARIGANCCVTEDVPPNAVVVAEKARILPRSEPRDNTFYSRERFARIRFQTREDYAQADKAARLRLEQAQPEELEEIYQLFRERVLFFRCRKLSQWGSYLQNHPRELFLEQIKAGEFYLIRDDSLPVACFRLSDDSENWMDDSPDALYLSRVVARPGYKNLGGYLVEQAKALCAQRGREILRLECVFGNPRLNEIWKSHGFTFVRDGTGRYHYALYEYRPGGETLPDETDDGADENENGKMQALS